MYKKVNITENSLQVLSLFTRGFDQEYYIREINEILKISPRTSQLILEDLESKGILESKKRGKIKSYKLRKNEEAKRYLAWTEQYKLITLLEKNPLLKEIISQIYSSVNGIGLIFGSYAKEIQNKKSDLDIFIVGEYKKDQIKKISKTFNIELNIKCYSFENFKKELKKDFLLVEVIKNHVSFKGSEEFINLLFENG